MNLSQIRAWCLLYRKEAASDVVLTGHTNPKEVGDPEKAIVLVSLSRISRNGQPVSVLSLRMSGPVSPSNEKPVLAAYGYQSYNAAPKTPMPLCNLAMQVRTEEIPQDFSTQRQNLIEPSYLWLTSAQTATLNQSHLLGYSDCGGGLVPTRGLSQNLATHHDGRLMLYEDPNNNLTTLHLLNARREIQCSVSVPRVLKPPVRQG